jgi:ketosteroid isomerase-like protein
MSPEDDIQKASDQFYAALNSMLAGNNVPMAEIWSHSAAATTMHPIGGREVGWDAVRESFAQVSGLAAGGRAQLDDRIIQVVGDLAYEVGVERGQAELAGEKITIDQRVTNIYRREAGEWKIVHHHADVSPAMLALLNRLQAAA